MAKGKNGKSCSFTQEEIDNVVAMANEGIRQKIIAEKYGCSVARIYYHVSRLNDANPNHKVDETNEGIKPEKEVRCKCPYCETVWMEVTSDYAGEGTWYKYCPRGKKGQCTGGHKSSRISGHPIQKVECKIGD